MHYRRNVFPIELPPLRERPNDIPQLISHFVNGFSRRMGKPIRLIPLETMVAFTSYSWPGNVRELQNLIERAVIRSNDGVLPNPLQAVERTPAWPQKTSTLSCTSGTFSDSVRSLILRTLEGTGWLIGGPDGAAARLGLPRTSLISKMKKLGISQPRSGNAPSTMAEESLTGLQLPSADQLPVRERSASLCDEETACVREFDNPSLFASEQEKLTLCFEFNNLFAERRLGDVQPVRGASEVQLFGQDGDC
jgi:hypothetical protein